MKTPKPLFFLFLILLFRVGQAQTRIGLDSCQVWARAHYPMTQQQALIEKTRAYSLENASKGKLPQVSIAGQATYQSEVTRLGIAVPGFTAPELSKDQYRLYTEIVQPLTDLNTIKRQQELIQSGSEVDQQRLEVDLYKIRERVSQLYFGILLLDEQVKQVRLLLVDIEAGMKKVTVSIANGTATRTQLHLLEAEQVKARQRLTEISATRTGYLQALSLFTGRELNDSVQFITPSFSNNPITLPRPELRLYDLQAKNLGIQEKLIRSRTLPRFSLFVQGGVGRPALNMLSNDFDPYYIGGLRLQWNLGNFYTLKNDKKIIALNQRAVTLQRDVFLLNTDLTLAQQNSDILKYESLLKDDAELVSLREKIKSSAQYQLENGVLTANDYITYVNAEEQARQAKALHELQLLKTRYDILLVKGY